MFMGTFINKVDSKNRVSVPHDFRAVLSQEEDYCLICFPSFTDSCLDGGGMNYIRKLQDMMEDLDPYDEVREAFEHSIIGESIRMPVDKDGRVTLTERFFRHAKIEDQVAFVGRGDHLQLWNPDILEGRSQSLRARARDNRHCLKPRLREPVRRMRRDEDQAETSPVHPAKKIIRPEEGGEW